jgi:hypothetical protein
MRKALIGLALLFAAKACALPLGERASLSKRQLITPEIYCEVDSDRPECKMLAALEVYDVDGSGGRVNRKGMAGKAI